MHCIYTDFALRSCMLVLLHLGPPLACMALCRHCIQNQHFTFIVVRSNSYLIACITPSTHIAFCHIASLAFIAFRTLLYCITCISLTLHFSPCMFPLLHHGPSLHLGLHLIALHAYMGILHLNPCISPILHHWFYCI